VLLGIAQLARPVALPLLPVWLAGLAWSAPPGTRTRAVWRCLAGFAPFAAGLAAYTWATTGNPFTASGSHLLLVGMEPRFTVGYLNCTFPPIDPATYLAAHPGALAHKLAAEGPRLLWAAFTRESGLLGVLLLSFLSALVPDRRPFAWTLVALMVGTVGLAALTVPNARFVVPFAPVLWAVGAAEAFALARPRLPGPATLALGLALAVVGAVWPSVSRWRHVEPPAVTEREWDALNGRLAEVLPPGPVASDVGPWISWGTGRITTLLPNTPDQLPALAARLRVAALVVSNEWVVRQPGGERWRAVLEGGESVAGWPTAAVVTAGRLRARVLVREIPH
jgi:hypothetical protein